MLNRKKMIRAAVLPGLAFAALGTGSAVAEMSEIQRKLAVQRACEAAI